MVHSLQSILTQRVVIGNSQNKLAHGLTSFEYGLMQTRNSSLGNWLLSALNNANVAFLVHEGGLALEAVLELRLLIGLVVDNVANTAVLVFLPEGELLGERHTVAP